ncbi:hypothetical protein H5410_014675 [Solanum commersonii]|uniref:Uncharacterized protein n=1 Tax=Solanum commersonii TaxID=4109 RepID=A0A9J5ZRW8_SOLCO|nr:hypothetical protein H5410_014675 [Solanum commersonii]
MTSPIIEEGVIILQLGSFKLVEVSTSKKTTNISKVYQFSDGKNGDTWILIACKKKRHQGSSKLYLSKIDIRSSTNLRQQCERIKFNTKSKYMNASSERVRRKNSLIKFFAELLLNVRV